MSECEPRSERENETEQERELHGLTRTYYPVIVDDKRHARILARLPLPIPVPPAPPIIPECRGSS